MYKHLGPLESDNHPGKKNFVESGAGYADHNVNLPGYPVKAVCPHGPLGVWGPVSGLELPSIRALCICVLGALRGHVPESKDSHHGMV
jgi:hypothetical protein